MQRGEAVIHYTVAKRCARCGEWKPADPIHYYRNPAAPDDLQSMCIECCKADRRGRWAKAVKRRIECARERMRRTSEATHA